MSTIIPLAAEPRERMGKGGGRSLRRIGRIPAVVYGKDKENIHFSLEAKEISNYYNKGGFTTSLFYINLNKQKYQVLPKSLQFHPVTDDIEHIDFIHISENAEVKVMIHIHFTNEDKSVGIKRGGILNIINHSIEVICHPSNIPHAIEINAANLDIGHSVHINDIILPENVRLASDRNITIATVIGRTSGEEEAPAAAAETTPTGSK